MAAQFTDLVGYFESLATSHVSIRHSATNKHFYRFELEEVLAGLAANIKYPALILEGYDFNYAESRSDNLRKKRTGAFMLIKRVGDPKDFDHIHEVWDELEVIAEDILVKMKADKESRLIPVLRDFNINECEGITFSIQQFGQYGVRVTFNLVCAVNAESDTEKWL